MKEIVIVPAGGLGNRMKAVSAAVRLAHACGSALTVKWFQDWGMGCRYSDLFMPLEESGVWVNEATWADKLLYDRPRKRNLWLPALWERLLFNAQMDEAATSKGMESDFDFVGWAQGRRVWMASNVYFMSRDIPADAFDMFHPIPRLQQRIDEMKSLIGPHCVGVHVRRTDNARSIAASPVEAFVQRMGQMPPGTTFYVASDSEEVKQLMRRTFPDRVITADSKAERSSLRGMEDALVEMYTLAHCPRILGSSFSTYSMTAASIGRSELEIIIKKS